MTFKDNRSYLSDARFTAEEIKAIRPKELVNYLNFKAFGTIEPTENDRPTLKRSNTLKFYLKSSLTSCLIKKIVGYKGVRSSQVNKLTRLVGILEVRGQGAPSQRRWEVVRCLVQLYLQTCHSKSRNVLEKLMKN